MRSEFGVRREEKTSKAFGVKTSQLMSSAFGVRSKNETSNQFDVQSKGLDDGKNQIGELMNLQGISPNAERIT
jgi:hypothetical protein